MLTTAASTAIYTNTTGISKSLGSHDITFNSNVIVSGDQVDITVNGTKIVEKLNLLERRMQDHYMNHRLESEFSELKKLGDQYREMVLTINEALATWKRLSE